MKTCPICNTVFDDSMNYCLEHGSDLVSVTNPTAGSLRVKTSEKTAEFRNLNSAESNAPTYVQNYSTFGDARQKRRIFPAVMAGVLGLGVLSLAAAAAVIVLNWGEWRTDEGNQMGTSATPVAKTPTPAPMQQVKAVLAGEETDSFKNKWVKCMVTNLTDRIIADPTVEAVFYDNDVKIDSTTATLDVKYMRPNETLPVWVRIPYQKKYNRIEVEAGLRTKTETLRQSDIFLDVPVTPEALLIKQGVTLYNFRRFPEPYYTVRAVVENNTDTKLTPKANVIFYNDKSEVVGYYKGYVEAMEPGQKAKIDSSTANSQIHGKAARYELRLTRD